MIKELIQTAKNVDLAIELGCQNLGVSREEAQFEIIDLPKKKLFGMKIIPAKVRVFVEVPDEAPAKPAAAPVAKPQPTQRPQREAKPENKERRPRSDAPQGEQRKPAGEAGQQRRQEQQPPRKQPEPAQRNDTPVEPDAHMSAKASVVVDYIKAILGQMGFEQVEVTPRFTQNGAAFALTGADLGAVIGRRGETLDALQYLAGLVANRLEGDYLRVTIDSGNYREKRERTLESLARKLALSAVRTGKSCTLEPMNPYERRIIHASVSQIRGATSSSIGEEPNRRVVIKSATGQPRSGGGDREHRGGYNKGRGGRGGNRSFDKKPREDRQQTTPSATPAPKQPEAPAAAPQEAQRASQANDKGGQLYGKITID